MSSLLNSIGGPVFALRWRGVLCPCLENPDDRNARKALALLQHHHVSWIKGNERGSSTGGMLSGWLGGGSGSNKQNQADATTAQLVFVDGSSTTELQVQPLPDDDEEEQRHGGLRLSKSGGYIKTIVLKDCCKVVATTNSIVIQGKTSRPGNKHNVPTTDLVRFQLLSSSQDDLQEIHDAMLEMIAWEARRQAQIPQDEREVDMENGIQARAQKAAHFAKREIEMKQQRRQREERKAKLVKEADGLKYTALAMANRDADIS